MQTLDTHTTHPPRSSVPELSSQPVHRLIVLIPSLDADPALTARRVWELANATGARIHFISLSSNAAQEPGLRRQLVLVSAMVNDGLVFSDLEVVAARNVVQVVRSRWQPGDMVVCFAEHRVGPLNRPLSHLLQANLDVPLFILSGIDLGERSRPNWLTQVAAWIGFLGIILGFFFLQARIDGLTRGGLQTMLLLISVCVEAGTIWMWNRLIG
jgi:hypothetical protein